MLFLFLYIIVSNIKLNIILLFHSCSLFYDDLFYSKLYLDCRFYFTLNNIRFCFKYLKSSFTLYKSYKSKTRTKSKSKTKTQIQKT